MWHLSKELFSKQKATEEFIEEDIDRFYYVFELF